MKAIVGIGSAVVSAIIALTVVLGSWYTIDQGERGVLLRNGAVIGTAGPGLGFKTPWIEEVVTLSVQSKVRNFGGMETYSRDQQPATLSLTVNYRLAADRVEEIYSSYGSEEGLASRLIDRQVHEKVRTVFGQFNAVTAIQDRARLNVEITAAVRESVVGPVTVESVQLENIDFSEAYEASIEQRMLAEVEVQKLQQNAEREKVQAEIVVTQATAQANAVRASAAADAEAIRLRGDAQAHVIRERGAALRDNPTLIELVQAEKWNGVLPTTMVPDGAVPFVSVR